MIKKMTKLIIPLKSDSLYNSVMALYNNRKKYFVFNCTMINLHPLFITYPNILNLQ